MSTHWKRYRKVVLKFHDGNKWDYDQCWKDFNIFLEDNFKIFTDFHYKWDYSGKVTGYHVNMYLKCSNVTRLVTQYVGPNRRDSRFFLKIMELDNIVDSCDWISYMYMREKVNFSPQRDNELLKF